MAADLKKYKPLLKYHRIFALSIVFTCIYIFYNHKSENEYYSNGQAKHSGRSEGGFNEGRWVWFYASGKMQMEGYFVKGKRNGKWKIYNENGNLISDRNYADDKLNGEALDYYDNGTLKMKGHFENDQLKYSTQFDVNGSEIKIN
jgi:antitoxin component YwqK of YwqJK toxin-antitoxin module